MNPPLSRREMLAGSSIVGGSCLAGCQGWTNSVNPNPSDTSEPDEDDNSLGLAYSEGRGSFQTDEEAHSGWVHIVSDGESADLTFDVRFCNELGEVEPELSRSTANEVVLRFTVTSEYNGETSSDGETHCEFGTHLVGGANVPRTWETLTVMVNDAEIQRIERTGTMPELRPLPDPIGPR